MTNGDRSDAAPARIGPYHIERELGRGGMGVVYLARDPRLERPVAIKALSAALSSNADWNARFTREARLLASLNHPNIATIHSLERDGELEYLTMELIPGQSLEAMIRSNSLELPDALAIGRQIARALEAAHGAGVIHRDLKPLNIMITPESHAKVLDFGLARRATSGDSMREESVASVASDAPSTSTSSATDETAVVDEATLRLIVEEDDATRVSGSSSLGASNRAGTPGSMSPEQIRGDELDARTDLWAFGCVLYECLSGARAFRGATGIERMRATLLGAPDLTLLPARTPDPIRGLIVSCLSLSLDQRLADAATARAVLETSLAQRSWEPTAAISAPTRTEIQDNLPNEVTPLVGRVREVAAVRELLEQHRLVTLTGVGGGGKTRLATKVGAESRPRFPDGVWLVELAPVADGADVVRNVARSLGVAEAAGRSLLEGVNSFLGPRTLLLILDNCEHVVEAAAELAGKLLASCPSLEILATSREVLGIPGESTFQVPPLQIVTDESLSFEAAAATEAIQLFAQRAAQVRSDFAVRPDNIEDIVEICSRLEGIPLAIELAAARTKALSLSEIARRLDDRFRLLKGSSRSALPHHQTLEALIDWSHSHLTQAEQRLFRRLSVFRGGWTLEAAEAICADDELEAWEIVDVLSRLIDKSLVVFTASGASPDPRYRMLETVREFAQTRWRESDDVPSVQRLHVDYFVKFITTAAPLLTTASQPEWLARIDADIDNLRAALACALEGDDAVPALQLSGQSLRYWIVRGQLREGRAAVERALAMPGADAITVQLGVALNAVGTCCYQLHELEAAAGYYRRAVDTLLAAGGQHRVSAPLMNLGSVHRMRGDLEQAVASYEESLHYVDQSDQWMVGALQTNIASVEILTDEYEKARPRYEIALAIHRKLGDRVYEAAGLMNLGIIAYRQERLADARAFYEESIAIFERVGERNMAAAAQVNYGNTLRKMGDEEAALIAFVKALRLVRDTGSMESMVHALEGVSQVSRFRGDHERAARLVGAAEGLRLRLGLPRQETDRALWDVENGLLAAEVGADAFARLWSEGEALEQNAAIALALELAGAEAFGSWTSRRTLLP